MAELRSPFDGGVIDVPEALVDRYVEGGWVKGETQRPVRRRKASEPDDKGE